MFQESRQKGQLSLNVTRQWLKTAYAELADENIRPESSISVAAFRTAAKQSRHAQIQVAVTKAIVGLIFDPPASSASAPSSASSTPSASPTLRSSPAASALDGHPETLYLDHTRLATLSKDAADFTALYMLMMLHRQLLHSGSAVRSEHARALTADELVTLKKEIWEIGPQHLGLCFRKEGDFDEKDNAERDRWRDDVSNIVLHLTVHAGEARSRPHKVAALSSTSSSLSKTRTPDTNLLTLATNWVHSNLRHDSPLSHLMRKRIRCKVEEIAIGLVLPSTKKPTSTQPAVATAPSDAIATSGLEPLMPEITHLAERLTKLVGIHMNVYGALYTQPGFVFP